MNKLLIKTHTVVARMSHLRKRAILLAVDVAVVPFAITLTIWLFGANLMPDVGMLGLAVSFFVLCAVAGLFSWVFGLPRIKLNAYEEKGILRTVAYSLCLALVLWSAAAVLPMVEQNGRFAVIFALVMLLSAVGVRLVMRAALMALYGVGTTRTRVLIYGAGQTGVQLAAALETDDAVAPVGFVDDNSTLHNFMVRGLPVWSPVRIEDLVREQLIDRVVLAMPSISRPKRARIARRLSDLGCEVSVLPSFAAIVGDQNLLERIESADPSNYLNRENLEHELDDLRSIYAGRTVMITGAGGSIGSELARQILISAPLRIVLFEISEIALYQLSRELDELSIGSDIEFVQVLGSVTDVAGVRRAIDYYHVDVILHAAAYKHVSMVEVNELAGLRNNVLGTKTVADAARAAEVEQFILVSTDKAVRPASVMGASKRMAELVVLDIASRTSDTRFAIVRFGNVLGSSGSVVPLFEEQIARGGPVTLSDRAVTRYFMTLTEAARLVLMAGNYTTGGDMFVLDMGDPVPIQKLAQQMIEDAGYSVCDAANPSGDIEIVIQGLKPGEKLHEELISPEATLEPTAHAKIRRAEEPKLSELEVASILRSLGRAIEDGDRMAARDVINTWIADSKIPTIAPAKSERIKD